MYIDNSGLNGVSKAKKLPARVARPKPRFKGPGSFAYPASFLAPASHFRSREEYEQYMEMHGIFKSIKKAVSKVAKVVTAPVKKVLQAVHVIPKKKAPTPAPASVVELPSPVIETPAIAPPISAPVQPRTLPPAANPAMMTRTKSPKRMMPERPRQKRPTISPVPELPATPVRSAPTATTNSYVPQTFMPMTMPQSFGQESTDRTATDRTATEPALVATPGTDTNQMLKVGGALAVVGGLLYVMHKRK